MSEKLLLTKAIELLNQGWCQGTFALGKDGSLANLFDVSAHSFCAEGALQKARYELNIDNEIFYSVYSKLEYLALRKEPFFTINSLANYNDNFVNSKKQIIELFKEVLND